MDSGGLGNEERRTKRVAHPGAVTRAGHGAGSGTSTRSDSHVIVVPFCFERMETRGAGQGFRSEGSTIVVSFSIV